MKKHGFIMAVVIPLVMVLVSSLAMAEQFTVGGKPLNLYGYITQDVSFSLKDNDYFDNEGDLKSALFNFFVEGDYRITDNLQFYLSGMLTVDWNYEFKHNDNSWEEREFKKSRDNLFVDDEYWQLLKEAHFTWTPGDFMFRVGKQIVVWGETDGFRLMDQINPLDQRRGFADVEFETTIIPIWLLRAEYYPQISTGWLQDLGFEFTFNPNADFIPNQSIQLGNDKAGVWAPEIMTTLPPPPLGPGGRAHVGSQILDIKEPNEFDPEGFEYGFRIKTIIREAVVTLNYFYGRDNDPAVIMVPRNPLVTTSEYDDRLIIHPFMEGRHPLFRFVGGTFSRDISPLKASFLGGVAPVLRLEALYAFDNTFATTQNDFEKSDELRWAIGIDWKVRIPLLNPRRSFTISTQFYHRRFLDYPSGYNLINPANGSNFEHPDNYQATLMINTAYFHEKLKPSFFWLRDITDRGGFYQLQTAYEYSNNWAFTLGAMFFEGDRHLRGFEPLKHKDYLYFKVAYKWG
jgi:hypothetical protein